MQQQNHDENRFAFGDNWTRFLSVLSEDRIATAEQSLRDMLGVTTLEGKRLLDIGSGSGLFSLAARRLGATVFSFDYDRASVACTAELKRRYFPSDTQWEVRQGSVLDREFLRALGTFDIVYSWGVLHHTGAMWEAIDNAATAVRDGGILFIALYNDQGAKSRIWTRVKRTYNRVPPLRPFISVGYFIAEWGARSVLDLLRLRPFRSWRTYRRNRGMSPWHDVVDWVGGYPFEVATPDAVVAHLRPRGFTVARLKTCGGKLGCNEFVLEKSGRT